THTTVHDSAATATTQSVNTTQATNGTSTILPTTALPPLGELVSDSVEITLLASLRDKLADYQQLKKNRPMATAKNYGGNITGIARKPETSIRIGQQPDTIIGVRPDDPTLQLIDQFLQQYSDPTSHPTSPSTVDLSPLISSIENKVAMYELFNLALVVSSFTEAIKKSFPAVATIYDNELKQLSNEINNYALTHDQGDTKIKRNRRTITKELTDILLRALRNFELKPMSHEMKVFFKGFEERRDAFNKALYKDDSLIDDHEFKEMFECMKSKTTLILGLKNYNHEIEQAIADGNYYRVGQITFSVNVLHNKVRNTPDNFVSTNPYLDLLIKISNIEAKQINPLLSLANEAAASVPINALVLQACAQDALDLAFYEGYSAGFCAGDLIATAIAGRYGLYANSLVSLANSMLYGFDYSRLPLQVRVTLQDALFYKSHSHPWNHAESTGLGDQSIYVLKILKKSIPVGAGILSQIRAHTFNSMNSLINIMLNSLPVRNLGTEWVQFAVGPNEKHICYFAFSKSNNLFRLTVQDHITGVTTVTGTTLEQLKTAIPNALGQFAREYKIPLYPGPQAVPVPGRGLFLLGNSMLDPLEDLELIKDSALTVKDILTHDPSQLRELDKERINALTTKYLQTVKNDATRKMLNINLKSLSQSESEALAEIAQMPMVYLMREVLTMLELHPNLAAYLPNKLTDVKLMNAYVVTTLDKIAKHQAASGKKTADADAQSKPQGAASAAAATDLATSTAGELVKLAIERDLSLLDPEPDAGTVAARASAAQPGGAHAAPDSQGSSGVSGSTIGGIIGGSLGGFAGEVGMALLAFKARCPECLSEMANEFTEDAS
ncbi:hypothetical protein, partial [Endozoicomonas sp. SESOKO1]|uniref:hypothetical protein n=1 Tax=Endozoicomonas sp. SESOKO1 TaxID=2828742 RepID=UPI0021473863